MIRINVLAADRPAKGGKKAAAAPGTPGALQAYLFLALFGGGAAVVCAALWWFESIKIKDLDTRMDAAKKRQGELQAIKTLVDEYEKKKRTLDAKIALIEKLQSEQSGPVHLMDEISRALPDYVWLVNMDQTGGGVRMKGQSNGLSAVADFITNLQHAGAPSCAEPPPPDKPADTSVCYFNKVELMSSADKGGGIFDFELNATYQNAFKAIKAGGAPAAGTPAGAPAAGAKP